MDFRLLGVPVLRKCSGSLEELCSSVSDDVVLRTSAAFP
jgi:hypothetical protein